MPADLAIDQLDPADPRRLPTSENDILQTVVIATGGMNSEESARNVEDAARGCNGVKRAKAETRKARVTVIFDPRVTHVPALHDAVLGTGHRPNVLRDAGDLSQTEKL